VVDGPGRGAARRTAQFRPQPAAPRDDRRPTGRPGSGRSFAIRRPPGLPCGGARRAHHRPSRRAHHRPSRRARHRPPRRAEPPGFPGRRSAAVRRPTGLAGRRHSVGRPRAAGAPGDARRCSRPPECRAGLSAVSRRAVACAWKGAGRGPSWARHSASRCVTDRHSPGCPGAARRPRECRGPGIPRRHTPGVGARSARGNARLPVRRCPRAPRRAGEPDCTAQLARARSANR
jgi:hypothetical protein